VVRDKTILLAEDNANDALFFRFALEKAGLNYPLEVLYDGELTLQYLKGAGPYGDRERFPMPSLLVLDINMPKVGGFEVLTWVRQQPQLERLPVIVLTASVFSSTVTTAYILGANSFLTKPENLTDFSAAVKQMCDFWLPRGEERCIARLAQAPPGSATLRLSKNRQRAA
jgi:CheY-like chemotaxis protein